MFDWFTTHCDFSQRTFNNLSHLVFSIQDCSCSLVLVDVDLDFVQKFFVHLLVFVDQRQNFVNFRIDVLISLHSYVMLFS